MRHIPYGVDSAQGAVLSPSEAAARAASLEQPLQAVEQQLLALGTALHHQDVAAVDDAAARLHVALAAAVDHFALAARRGGVPAPLRRRLAEAGGRVAAQREALARATASLDRAIDVLMPSTLTPSLYSAQGASDRLGHGGALLA
jgi:hypothetical protein